MKIITISGIDGSGKSTQLKKLEEYLAKRKKKTVFFHAVTFSLINNLLWKKRQRQTEKYKRQKNENLNQATIFDHSPKAVTSGNYLTILARKIILLIDILRFKSFIKKKKKEGTDYLLSDRYFYDQIINILYLSYKKRILGELIQPKGKKINIKLSPLLKLADKLIPSSQKSFFLDVPPDTALSRDRKIEQGKEYLVIKRVLYKKFLPHWNISLLEGTGNREDIQQTIREALSKSPTTSTFPTSSLNN
jgi:thymidylate kinase